MSWFRPYALVVGALLWSGCCTNVGGSCSNSSNCCSQPAGLMCGVGRCCLPSNSACTNNSECCTGLSCIGGRCGACTATGTPCSLPGAGFQTPPCCSGTCRPDGVCGAPCQGGGVPCDYGSSTCCASCIGGTPAGQTGLCMAVQPPACGATGSPAIAGRCCDPNRVSGEPATANGVCCAPLNGNAASSSECCRSPGQNVEVVNQRCTVCVANGFSCQAGSICCDQMATCTNGACGRIAGRPCDNPSQCQRGGAHTDPACTAGLCAVQCTSGFANCDGDTANGCEVALQTDARNCGACGTVCGAGTSCVGGVCSSACPTGTTRCAGRCVHTANNDAHCNGCDMPCAANQICQHAACGSLAELISTCARVNATATTPFPSCNAPAVTCCIVTLPNRTEERRQCVPAGSGRGECRND